MELAIVVHCESVGYISTPNRSTPGFRVPVTCEKLILGDPWQPEKSANPDGRCPLEIHFQDCLVVDFNDTYETSAEPSNLVW